MIEKKAVLINASVKPSENSEEVHKLEVFAKIIKDITPEQKIIIFSDYPSVFKDIEAYFEVKNIKFVTLDKGTITEIDKSVERYKNGDAQILIADSTMYGCGMNFENTTDIILIHKINSEMEKQVIGRAQRPGRKSVLQIHRLLHLNEL
jgi:SNF2 family DNA or RNA helicase